MSCLHLVSIGLEQEDAIKRLLSTVTPEDAVVLLGNGLQLAEKLTDLPCPCYQWKDESTSGLNATEVVKLTEQHDKTLSWH